ncbi:MAG: HlyC/CorC family transporter [Lachnospiraceae bacterium]|nr:HlyC/CorC family transporter [Lachnospiraceae bacterium]
MESGDVAIWLLIVLIALVIIDILIRLFKKKAEKEPKQENEIIDMVNESHEQGVLETDEATMINNIFNFDDKEAGEIMTNRSNIVAIDKDTGLLDAINFMLNNSNSRYPVYDENLDHVIGILYLKDAMRLHSKDESFDKPIGEIKNLIRKALVVLETTNIDDLFKTMQSKKTQMAIVVDEYGQTVGLVSMEDILEEIVGNIMDEYDVDEMHIRGKGDDTYIIDGLTPLSEVEVTLGIKFDTEYFETLNGFMISRLDRLPEKKESFKTDYGGYEFSILKVENRMISKVSVKKIDDKEKEEDL